MSGDPSDVEGARPQGRAPFAPGTVVRLPASSRWLIVLEDAGMRYTSPESLPQILVCDPEDAERVEFPVRASQAWQVVPAVRGVRCGECGVAWLIVPEIATLGLCEDCAQAERDADAAEPVVDSRGE